MKVLLLDPDRTTVRSLESELAGAQLQAAHGQGEGLRLIRDGGWDLILLDASFSDAGMEILERLREASDSPPVVLMTTEPSMEMMMEALRVGAHEVLAKPLPLGRVRQILTSLEQARSVRPLPEKPAAEDAFIGSSPEMLHAFSLVARSAGSDATVLVLGESGTGKEMVARALHSLSPRAKGPFMAINCAAIPENLLESELFGHEKGAFTGAVARRVGRFERANGGTLFLDEIGDMSLALQSKILRALQEREVERVGGEAPVPIDVRVVAATNHDLQKAVEEGKFRMDLFYRLAVVSVGLPPLRQRGCDLDRLAEHFAAYYARRHRKPIRAVAEEVYRILRQQPWPGNVRQLRNVVERAVVMSSGEVLLPQHLPAELLHSEAVAPAGMDGPLCTLEEMERRMIRRALQETRNSLTTAAELLGIHRNTLRRKMEEYGITTAAE